MKQGLPPKVFRRLPEPNGVVFKGSPSDKEDVSIAALNALLKLQGNTTIH